ncbi:hypothetical protein [Kribbella sp. NPDC050459]|jgi:hypothetical protein|uniref:DUF7144 family membrane protein n=1 Tax=Kribbella sp. NPDC050459 TaxID=3155785 RepID=UPI0033CC0BC8
MTYGDMDSRQSVPSAAVGGLAFAASVMVIVGSFSVVAGLAAILDDDYLVVSRRYAFDLDTVAWGWIHLVLGLAFVAVGVGLFANKSWAGMVAIVLAGLIAIDYFFFIPFQPVWSLVVIALSAWVIWAVTRARQEES